MNVWKTYTPTPSMPWNLPRVKHLHRRAAFGATWTELQRDLVDTPTACIARILNGSARSDGQRDDFENVAKIIGDAAANSNDANRLRAWWLFRILFTPDPLQERLTLLWHDHFATSNLKVQDLRLMRQQNELFRQAGQGGFAALLKGILQDPAMLVWLDANSNRKDHPNENFARELLELFTLGVGHYTERDVKETARALTGLTTKGLEVRVREKWHDTQVKTILGQTDAFDADRLGSLLASNAATSRRLAWRLCDMFMGEGVADEQAIEELADGLRAHNLNISWGVETILSSELFYSEPNIASRISSPVEYVIGVVRALELLDQPPSTLLLAEWCGRLGQELFSPPNVGGWNGGRSWLTSRTIIGRTNFAAALVAGELRAPISKPSLVELAEKHRASSNQSTVDKNAASGTFELFEALLLSAPCASDNRTPLDVATVVTQLLSCPQAHLT